MHRALVPAAAPDLRIVGSSAGVTMGTDHRVTVGTDGTLAYERLFTDLTPGGEPMAYVYGGTFAPTHAGGRL